MDTTSRLFGIGMYNSDNSRMLQARHLGIILWLLDCHMSQHGLLYGKDEIAIGSTSEILSILSCYQIYRPLTGFRVWMIELSEARQEWVWCSIPGVESGCLLCVCISTGCERGGRVVHLSRSCLLYHRLLSSSKLPSLFYFYLNFKQQLWMNFFDLVNISKLTFYYGGFWSIHFILLSPLWGIPSHTNFFAPPLHSFIKKIFNTAYPALYTQNVIS